MKGDLQFYCCPDCHGTGKQIIAGHISHCDRCDGTGNALVDGAAERHKRAIAEIEARGDSHDR